jgi:hypothetical protein
MPLRPTGRAMLECRSSSNRRNTFCCRLRLPRPAQGGQRGPAGDPRSRGQGRLKERMRRPIAGAGRGAGKPFRGWPASMPPEPPSRPGGPRRLALGGWKSAQVSDVWTGFMANDRPTFPRVREGLSLNGPAPSEPVQPRRKVGLLRRAKSAAPTTASAARRGNWVLSLPQLVKTEALGAGFWQARNPSVQSTFEKRPFPAALLKSPHQVSAMYRRPVITGKPA